MYDNYSSWEDLLEVVWGLVWLSDLMKRLILPFGNLCLATAAYNRARKLQTQWHPHKGWESLSAAS